jgi:hypothetical protein
MYELSGFDRLNNSANLAAILLHRVSDCEIPARELVPQADVFRCRKRHLLICHKITARAFGPGSDVYNRDRHVI